jgi:hypothetical protein
VKLPLNVRSLVPFALVLLASALVLAAAADPAQSADAKLKELGRFPAYRELARQPIAEAERALRRAREARAAGDAAHAVLLEQTAEEWAGTGMDLVRASQVESEAARLQQQAAEAEAKLVRAQALLEETSARRSLALQKLQELSEPPAVKSRVPSVEPAKPAAGKPGPRDKP